MQKTNNKLVVKKALVFSLFMMFITPFMVENPMPNLAIYLLVVGIVSFTSFWTIKFITARAYKKFSQDTDDVS